MSIQDDLDALLRAAQTAYAAHVTDPHSVTSLDRIFATLNGAKISQEHTDGRLPVCTLLDNMQNPSDDAQSPLHALFRAFIRLEPALSWYKRKGATPRANHTYWEGHANTMIAGPSGLVAGGNAMLGVTLTAPGVRYPNHTHPPEETYLVMSEGDFSQDGETWFTPGIGGTIYNPPGITHAMRSHDKPLFAMWALWGD